MDESIPIETIESGPGTDAVANNPHQDVTICRAFWHAGRQCRVVRFRSRPDGWYCGYVQMECSSSSETTLRDLDGAIDAHGGLTYGVDAEGWIGFDTNHAFDVSLDAEGNQLTGSDDEYGALKNTNRGDRPDGLPHREWTPAAVAAECERIAEQLTEASGDQ